MRLLGRIGRFLAGFLALCLGLALVTRAPGDPALYPGAGDVTVTVIDHGYHTGLVLPLPALRAAALEIGRSDPGAARRIRWLTELHPWADWVEIGWGDAAFYQATPGIGDLDPWLSAKALFWPTPSAVQVVPGIGPPETEFPRSGRAVLGLGAEGFARLARRLAATLAPDAPAPLGPSLYGSGAFYPATPPYHALMTCNQWTSALLRAAGVPSSWFVSATSAGLMAELRFRAF